MSKLKKVLGRARYVTGKLNVDKAISKADKIIRSISLLKEQAVNSLKKKQALVMISKKIITIIHSLLKKQTIYQPGLAFNQFR